MFTGRLQINKNVTEDNQKFLKQKRERTHGFGKSDYQTSRNGRLTGYPLSSSSLCPPLSAVLSTAGLHRFQNFLSPITNCFSFETAATEDDPIDQRRIQCSEMHPMFPPYLHALHFISLHFSDPPVLSPPQDQRILWPYFHLEVGTSSAHQRHLLVRACPDFLQCYLRKPNHHGLL